MAQTPFTRESTNTVMEPTGHNLVVILMVRLLGIKVDTVCRFRLTAIDWPSAPLEMTGVAQALGTPECTKSVHSVWCAL